MVKSNKPPVHNQQSEKLRSKPLKGPVEIADFGDVSYVHIANGDYHARDVSTSESQEIMSTSQLISTARQIWDSASRSLARYQPKTSFDYSSNGSPKYTDPCILIGNDNFGITNLIDRGSLQVNLNSSSYFSCIVQQSLMFVGATRRMQYVPCNYQFIEKLFRQSRDDGSIKHDILLEEENSAELETLYKLTDKYGLMNQISVWPKLINMNTVDTSRAARNEGNSSSGTVDPCMSHEIPYLIGLCVGGTNRVNLPMRALCTDNLFHGFQNKYCATGMSMALSLSLRHHLDGYERITSPDSTHEPNQINIEGNHLLVDKMRQCENLDTQDELQNGNCSTDTSKPHPLLANQEHAVSGALAGIFVSLCLHPIDTIKTIVQSCQPGKQSICYIGQSVLSERGIPGLYRGISSNITTSAPISAIYTFTYESVKELLLPSLVKEYHSVAHCTGGACASIATSFVFTPSERIKQQMQVNSTYQNCWNAVQRIIEVGGLRSLYAGWGAVLCRNIPHSIIKFYTYESLKQIFTSSQPPNTLQTLLCGGVAGSTAALFSTPFDVVKTRLQTQMPGSGQRYHSILYALQDIRKHEGFRGLYRGLIPRLAMYMSQGALFFASYEFFKNFLSLGIHHKKSEIAAA